MSFFKPEDFLAVDPDDRINAATMANLKRDEAMECATVLMREAAAFSRSSLWKQTAHEWLKKYSGDK